MSGAGLFPPQGTASGVSPTTGSSASTTISTSGYYDNTGASGTVTFTFAGTAGITAKIVRVASQEVRVAPVSGSQIVWSGGTMGVDEYLRLTADGDRIEAIVDLAGDVRVFDERGSIQEQTP